MWNCASSEIYHSSLLVPSYFHHLHRILLNHYIDVATKCRGDSMGRMIFEHASSNPNLTFISNYKLVDNSNSVKLLMEHSFKTLAVGDLHLTFTVQPNCYYIKGVVIYYNTISWKAWQYKLVPLQDTKKTQIPTEILFYLWKQSKISLKNSHVMSAALTLF